MQKILTLEHFHNSLKPSDDSLTQRLQTSAEQMTDLLLNNSEYVLLQKQKGKVKTMHKNSKSYKESMKSLFYVELFGPFFLCSFEEEDLHSLDFFDLVSVHTFFSEYSRRKAPKLGSMSHLSVRVNSRKYHLTVCNATFKLFCNGRGDKVIFLGDFQYRHVLVFFLSREIPLDVRMQVHFQELLVVLYKLLEPSK